jgi:hypothetical protein
VHAIAVATVTAQVKCSSLRSSGRGSRPECICGNVR